VRWAGDTANLYFHSPEAAFSIPVIFVSEGWNLVTLGHITEKSNQP